MQYTQFTGSTSTCCEKKCVFKLQSKPPESWDPKHPPHIEMGNLQLEWNPKGMRNLTDLNERQVPFLKKLEDSPFEKEAYFF